MSLGPELRPEGTWQPPMPAPPARRGIFEGSGHRGACVAAVVAAVPVAATAAWWLIGNLSFTGRPPDDLDYTTRAPDVPHWVVDVFGPVALTVIVAISISLISAVVTHRIDRRWLTVAGGAAFTGALVAGIGRMDTAGVVGANIGGGIAVLFGVPLAIAVAVTTMFGARRILRASA